MRRSVILVLLLLATSLHAAAPATTNNDDSCDIGVYPAATLLLPYFQIETARREVDTFFTVTNTSHLPQIAKVTIWSDWSFPVLTFPLFLTGYDVQSISMYDVVVNGIIAPTNANLTAGGTSSDTTPGYFSAANSANPNVDVFGCGHGLLPGILQPAIRAALQSALQTGRYTTQGSAGCGTTDIGSAAKVHPTLTTAVGYITIDVTSRCTATLPTDPAYYANEILFDNVLTGDYAVLDKSAGSNFAGGNPLVHIRAVPEGGPAGSVPVANGVATDLPYTFYGRYINGQTPFEIAYPRHLDRRQPLPSAFMARFIQGGGTLFNTDLKIWREGRSGAATCATASSNAALLVPEIVRFDEHENPTTFAFSTLPFTNLLPPSSRRASTSSTFPPLSSPASDTAGWLYLNLDSGVANSVVNTKNHPNYTAHRPSQNWVVVSMTGAGSTAGLFGVEFDATAFRNGCSPADEQTTANGGTTVIGPNGGALVCPPGFVVPGGQPCISGSGAYTGTNVNP